MNERILVADDETSITAPIVYALKREGFLTEIAHDGQVVLEKTREFQPHVIILDIMMPKLNGYDVCKKLEGENIGILLLTAKDDIVDKVLGLELGADDYITKPFDMRELMARVKSVLRRITKEKEAEQAENIKVKDLKIMYAQRKVYIKDQLIDFKPKEFDLLYKLLSNTNIVFTRDQLLDSVWGIEYAGGTRTIDIHIQRIRKKIGNPYENLIITVHGVGYKGIGEIHEI